MNIKLALLLLLATLTLSGCALFRDPLPVIKYTERPKLELPDPQPVNQAPVQWVVITKENWEAKLKELEAQHGQVVLFAITPDGYQNLVMNAADLRRFIQQQTALIGALKKYYESPLQNPNPK